MIDWLWLELDGVPKVVEGTKNVVRPFAKGDGVSLKSVWGSDELFESLISMAMTSTPGSILTLFSNVV